VRHGTVLMTFSEYVKSDVVSTLGVDERRVRVTPLAAGSRFRPIRDKNVLAEGLARFGLGGQRSILSVGTLEPRKNQVRRALACGTPVVCSGTTSLPEVVGDAAVLVDPENEVALADALERVVLDERLRADLVERGLRRAAQFSWDRTARLTWEAYEWAVRP